MSEFPCYIADDDPMYHDLAAEAAQAEAWNNTLDRLSRDHEASMEAAARREIRREAQARAYREYRANLYGGGRNISETDLALRIEAQMLRDNGFDPFPATHAAQRESVIGGLLRAIFGG